MSEGFSVYLHRYLHRSVSVLTWDHVRAIGNLAEITPDAILLTNVLVRDSHEYDSWSAHLAVEDVLENRGNLWPELVIQRHLISTVTLVDPRGAVNPEALPNVQPETEVEASEDPVQLGSSTAPPSPDGVCVELGLGLNSLVQQMTDQSRPLEVRLRKLRTDLQKSMGFELRPFRIHGGVFELPPNCFRLVVHGTEVFRTELQPDKLLAVNPGNAVMDIGVATKDPAFGLEARWIDPQDEKMAMSAGFTVASPLTVIATTLQERLKPHLASLLTYEAVSAAVESLRESNPITVSTLMPSPVTLRTLFEVLRHLVDQGIVINPLRPILESIARNFEPAGPMERLVSNVRKDIYLNVARGLIRPNGELPSIIVAPPFSQKFASEVQIPSRASDCLDVLKQEIIKIVQAEGISRLALFVPNEHRNVFSSYCQRLFPEITVLSFDECSKILAIKFLGSINLANPRKENSQVSADSNTSSELDLTKEELAAHRKPR
jgi:flagellar biosynthesis protein FlhA